MEEQILKKCSNCGEEKILSEFYKAKNGKYGVRNICKLCEKEEYLEKRDSLLEYKRTWYKENKEQHSKKAKQWRKKNRKKLLKSKKDYYEANKIKILEQQKQKRVKLTEKNKELKRQNHKRWRDKNKDKVRLIKARAAKKLKETNPHYFANYIEKRRKIDLNFKLTCNLRGRIYNALNGKGKSKRTLELLGCSVEFLKQHLESQFKDGMSWDNWGTGNNGKGMKEWHIDHIRPCASFDLSNPKQQEQCFHYSNLQPLWAKLNLIKHNNK